MADMATSLFVPVEEYLRTVYRPDCDYVDGVVEERNLGEVDHGYVQNNIGAAFKFRSRQTGLIAIIECRVQTKPTRFRIPDVVLTWGKPHEQIVTQPPVLCVEILSPEDRLERIKVRIQEYLDFGVPSVWLIDPEAKTLIIYRKDSFEPLSGSTVQVHGTDVEISLSEMFD